MSIFSEIFAGGAKGIIDGVGNIVDRFVQTSDEKAAIMMEVERLANERFAQAEQSARTTVDARMQVIVAELQHGDAYTKRTRPMIARWGLYAILWNYAIVPTLGVALAGWVGGEIKITSIALPTEFWFAWGGIVGTYAIGRSFEKIGKKSKLVDAATGNGDGLSGLFGKEG